MKRKWKWLNIGYKWFYTWKMFSIKFGIQVRKETHLAGYDNDWVFFTGVLNFSDLHLIWKTEQQHSGSWLLFDGEQEI